MMKLVLFDGKSHRDLLPLTYTRPTSYLRVGIFTIIEKWQKSWKDEVGTYTLSFLADKYPNAEWDEMLFVSAAVCPNNELVDLLSQIKIGQKVMYGERTIAFASNKTVYESCAIDDFNKIEYKGDLSILNDPGDIFELNEVEIGSDLSIIDKSVIQVSTLKENKVKGDRLFIGEGVEASDCILNTETGPIYLGKNSKLLEGSVIRGPFALCEGSIVKMSAKIYGATTVGPFSKVGGELNNVVIQGFSNKGHDGFLGNSVIGEWCNLGADTNTSNLKNNYGEVSVWNYDSEGFSQTDRQFQGLIMGDHSKTGINTMLNTGTTVGVSANIFGGGFPPKFVPSFSWGGKEGFQDFEKVKALEVAERMMERREMSFSDLDKGILSHIFKVTAKYRT